MQKHVNLVDLVKSFPTNIFLQNLASIQKRTSPIKFAHLAEESGNGSVPNLSTKVSSKASGAAIEPTLSVKGFVKIEDLKKTLAACNWAGPLPLDMRNDPGTVADLITRETGKRPPKGTEIISGGLRFQVAERTRTGVITRVVISAKSAEWRLVNGPSGHVEWRLVTDERVPSKASDASTAPTTIGNGGTTLVLDSNMSLEAP